VATAGSKTGGDVGSISTSPAGKARIENAPRDIARLTIAPFPSHPFSEIKG
jgi:hypothetical protein